MIDTKELRRLAQAAKNSCESVEWSHKFRSGCYSQGEIISGEENILIVCGANYGCWRDADDGGDSQFKALGDFVAAANPAAISEILDRLEAAEKERDALRAKITEMEQQEPVAWLHETRRDSDVVTDAVKHVWGKVAVGSMAAYSIPLYTLPSAKGEEK